MGRQPLVMGRPLWLWETPPRLWGDPPRLWGDPLWLWGHSPQGDAEGGEVVVGIYGVEGGRFGVPIPPGVMWGGVC